MTRLLLVFAAVLSLAGCGPKAPPPQRGWVLHSRLQFLSADLLTAGVPLPLERFRLFFPYIAGDLYGAATTGDFIHPVIQPDLSFSIDFGRAQQDLLRSLQPTEFSLDYLRIDPANARIARLAPLALQRDGIEQVAAADWVDPRRHEWLMLVYFDRPARITGAFVRNDYTVRYNIRANTAGYVWIARRPTADNEQMYTEVAQPETVVLALTAPAVSPAPAEPPSAPKKAALPAHKGIPGP